ncbi:hypothetical protein NHQ30_001359 [Ciborinia camelliae]|nr:hypothetical protein NHQ30_001359 [Ciborinia camelliae]
MDLPMCINGVYTTHSKLRSLVNEHKKIRPFFRRPGLTSPGRARIYDSLLWKNKMIYLNHARTIEEKSVERAIPFERFSDFPPEIRDCIWEFSLPGPRILSLRASLRNEVDDAVFPADFQYFGAENPPNPSALTTCRDARAVARRRYQPILELRSGLHCGRVYADVAGGDLLYIDDFNFDWRMDPYRVMRYYPIGHHQYDSFSTNLDRVERMIISQSFLTHLISRGFPDNDISDLINGLQKLPNLKQLLLEVDSHDDKWSDGPGTVQIRELFASDHARPDHRAASLVGNKLLSERTADDIAQGLRQVGFVSTSKVPNIPVADWLVDLTEHHTTASLLKRRKKSVSTSQGKNKPSKRPKQQKNKSSARPANRTIKKTRVVKATSDEATGEHVSETRAQRYERRCILKDS